MNIAVIGGGASGMMAALQARELGARVTVFERQARVGRKLLATTTARIPILPPESWRPFRPTLPSVTSAPWVL